MRRTGFSLIELLIVIVILGIVAKVTIPMFFSMSDEQKLEQAASDIIQALRFARSEAMRRGTCIEAIIEPDGTLQPSGFPNKLELVMWSLCGNIPRSGTRMDVFNPLDKKLYVFYNGKTPNTGGVTTQSVSVLPLTIGYPYRIWFQNNGVPMSSQCSLFCISSTYAPFTSDANITLAFGAKKRIITVNASGNIY